MVLSPEVAQGPAEKADPVTGQLVQLEMVHSRSLHLSLVCLGWDQQY